MFLTADFWNSSLGSAIVGAGSAALIFIIGEIWRFIAGRMEKTERLVSVLFLTLSEIDSYIFVLGVLCDQLSKLADESDEFQKNPGGKSLSFTLPTYSVYPELLNRLRSDLADVCDDPTITKKVVELHFELAHVGERLREIKEKPLILHRTTTENMRGFAKLVEETRLKFLASRALVLNKLNDEQRSLCRENFT